MRNLLGHTVVFGEPGLEANGRARRAGVDSKRPCSANLAVKPRAVLGEPVLEGTGRRNKPCIKVKCLYDEKLLWHGIVFGEPMCETRDRAQRTKL